MQARQCQAKHYLGGALLHKNPQTKGQVSNTQILQQLKVQFCEFKGEFGRSCHDRCSKQMPLRLVSQTKIAPQKKNQKQMEQADEGGRGTYTVLSDWSRVPFLIGVYF